VKIVKKENVIEKKFNKYLIKTGLNIKKNKIETGTVIFKSNSRIPREGFGVHNFDEISYIIEGKINVHFQEESFEVEKGDYIYIPKREKHYSSNVLREDCIVLYIKVNN